MITSLPFSTIPTTPNSAKLALAGGGAANTSAALGVAPAPGTNVTLTSIEYIVTSDVGCFVRVGATCLADGTDRYLPPNFPIRAGVPPGGTISGNGATAGNIYITPGG